MNILGIETSCDETSAAVLLQGRIGSNIISSQHCHTGFGGVIPELASREHERMIVSIVERAVTEANITKNELDCIAATAGPGLIGAIMVGLCFAEGMAFALGIPFVPVNHIEAHMFSVFIPESPEHRSPDGPFVSLTVSGGHTLLSLVQENLSYEVIGRTLNDAAGEAFDKTGKMLGLPYPAGPVIDRLASTGDPGFHAFPKALTSSSQTSRNYRENFDFSFSGLKTSVRTWLQKQSGEFVAAHLHDIAASIQHAIVTVLAEKAVAAALHHRVNTIAVAGGVSANSSLRNTMKEACMRHGIELFIPGTVYSTDNAAMIASLAALMLSKGVTKPNRYDVPPFASFGTGSRKAALK